MGWAGRGEQGEVSQQVHRGCGTNGNRQMLEELPTLCSNKYSKEGRTLLI